jgi:hypothetical protein
MAVPIRWWESPSTTHAANGCEANSGCQTGDRRSHLVFEGWIRIELWSGEKSEATFVPNPWHPGQFI